MSHRPTPTGSIHHFFIYDNHNHFIFNRKQESRWPNFFVLVGNFHIDWKENEQIFKILNKTEDKESSDAN